MWSSLDLFRDILPCCDVCKTSFDSRAHSPQMLPCGHTYCLKCLEQEKKKKKRKCPCCSKKFKSFTTNQAFVEVVERVTKRRVWAEEHSKRCDECDIRFPLSYLRRCHTCEDCISKHVTIGFMECLLCLECCVDRHNGHELSSRHLEKKSICVENTNSQPRAFSTPKTNPRPGDQSSKRTVTAAIHSRPPSGCRRSSKPVIMRDRNKNEVVVYEESSPLYLPSSITPEKRRKWSARLPTFPKRWSIDSDEIADGDSRSSGVISDEYRSDPETIRVRCSKERHASDSAARQSLPHPTDTVRSCFTDPNMSYAYIAT